MGPLSVGEPSGSCNRKLRIRQQEAIALRLLAATEGGSPMVPGGSGEATFLSHKSKESPAKLSEISVDMDDDKC